MSNPNADISELLSLEPLVDRTMPFLQYLKELKTNPERADASPSLLVRAVYGKGLVNIEETDEDRRPYLEQLAMAGIPAFAVFDDICGGQRTVARLLAHYTAAASNGYQLRQMLILIGGPGSGKSFLADALKKAVEQQIVYAVSHCRFHENPINLLKLLPADKLNKLAKALDMEKELPDLLRVALDPCPDCFKRVMGDAEKPVKEPNLANIEVEALRLSSRSGGISTWTPTAQSCTLHEALRQGSRGIVDLPDAFLTKDNEPGKPHELIALLDAAEQRRLPGGGHGCGASVGFSPLDTAIIISTNRGAYDEFLKSLGKDADAFTRRSRIITIPYNTILCEEVRAYREFLKTLKATPHWDPLMLRMVATLAIVSRMLEPESGQIDLISRMRLYNGERDVVKAKPKQDTYNTWGTTSSTQKDSKPMSVSDLWKAADESAAQGKEEGSVGLDIPFMLATVSAISEAGLNSPLKHKCVSALQAITILRRRIKAALLTPGLTAERKDVLQRCDKYLQNARDNNTVGMIEQEYRRLLRTQILKVFSPDFDKRAQEDFETYKLHGYAYAQGDSRVKDPRIGNREVEVNVAFLDDIDRYRTGTSWESTEDKKKFRGSLDARINQTMLEHAEEHGEGSGSVAINWETIPELARGIRARLEADIAKKVDRILTTANVADLKEDERRMRDESLQRFKEFGYCEACLEQALNYCKEFKLWNSQS